MLLTLAEIYIFTKGHIIRLPLVINFTSFVFSLLSGIPMPKRREKSWIHSRLISKHSHFSFGIG